MAFTIEQVQQAIIEKNNLTFFLPGNELEQSVNYPVISGYLTGQQQLGNLVTDQYLHYWGILLLLINDAQTISENEELVLDVLNHPLVFQYAQYSLNRWLIDFYAKKRTPDAFSSLLNQLKRRGLSNNQIASFLLSFYELQQEKNGLYDIDPNTKEFLAVEVKAANRLIYPSVSAGQYNPNWMPGYFRLLEEINPALAIQYLEEAILNYGPLAVHFLASYEQGKYIPRLISYITESPNNTENEIQQKLGAFIMLFEKDNEKFRQPLTAFCRKYLEWYSSANTGSRWENSYHIKELEQNGLNYLPYSSCAFYFILRFEKDTALPLLQKWFDKKGFVHEKTLNLMCLYNRENALPFIEKALAVDFTFAGLEYYKYMASLLQTHFKPDEYLPMLWPLIYSKSKPLRSYAAAVVAENDPLADDKAIALLNNKNTDTRQTAALILNYCGSQKAIQAVMALLNTEINDNTRDILLETVSAALPEHPDASFIENVISTAKERGKLHKPVEAWLSENELPLLYFKNGTALSETEIRFLLYRMSRTKAMRPDLEAKFLLPQIDKSSSAAFSHQLIKLYTDKGAKPEHKWMMALAALLGNDEIVDKIRININKWIEEGRYKMAEHGVGALALLGSDKALRWVEWYSRKYKSKKANVGAAATHALETAAEELGISTHELGDRIVPDFGFDGLFKHFTVAGENYRAFIDHNFKLAFFNEDNKKLKAIPAAANTELKEDFKEIAREVRDVVKSQSARMEYYLIVQRRWNRYGWEKFFIQNPVMFIYATKILWGEYDPEGKLLQAFICLEDRSLVNENNDEIDFPGRQIGMVHPSQLNPSQLQTWKQQFFDLSITPVFPQLDRNVPDYSSLNLQKPIITQFAGKKTKEGSIKATLEKYGWHRGNVGDGGMVESFNLLHAEKSIEAVLEVEGVGAGFGWGMEECTGRLFIIDKKRCPGKWFKFPNNDDDDTLIKPADLPQIFLSEMLAAVEAIKPKDM